MFGMSLARSSMIFEARNSLRRWTMASSDANLEMKIESSIAESPPPITTTFSPLKKAPSQTPQVETPRPPSSISPGMPSRLGTEALHQLRPHDPFREPGVVLDVGGVLELAAPLETLDQERLEVGTGGVDGGRIAGAGAANDDHVLDSLLVHVLLRLAQGASVSPPMGIILYFLK